MSETAKPAKSAPPASPQDLPQDLPPGIRSPGLPEGYDPRAAAHGLLRTVRAGTLATAGRDGFPFASLVNVATDLDGSPVLLLSGLSAHTQNLAADPRCSVLLGESGKGDPLAHPRVTLIGRMVEAEDEALRQRLRTRFLARHPKSALYADFGDFGFWRMDLARAHLNGGFARAAEFDPAALLSIVPDANELAALEAGALEHLNADHGEAVQLYATVLLGQKKARWRAAALDPEGLVLTAGDLSARLNFPQIVLNGADLRAVLAGLAKKARSQASS
ncbi:MAG: HugZ family protein [Beijerinckiaceae bacterium]